MHAWAEVCHLLQSSKSPLTGFLYNYVLHGWRITDQTRLSSITPRTPTVFLIQQSCVIILYYVAKWFVRMLTREEKWRHKGSHSFSVSGSNRLVWLQTWKKRWAGALLSENAAVLCENHHERVTQRWTSPSEEEEERKTFWPSGNFLVWYFLDAF